MTTREAWNFAAKVTVNEETGCWEWTACIQKDGYGLFTVAGRLRPAHRALYEHVHGVSLSLEEQVLHRCDNRKCVNPEHLFVGTHQDNMDDGVRKQRFAYGERNSKSKLTDEKVREIHRLYSEGGLAITEIADRFGVHYSIVHDIVKGVTWKHLKLLPQDRMRGEQLKFARLNAEAVKEIRRLAREGVHEKQLGARFNVHPNTVRDVIFGRTWKHVE